ncbi:DUF368 domain-containing protein [Longirhabdus pacifica]|uniref:DUF368 domain-containing protein n=1 Tax=Longirhabdus pacifica TaxID=2305227 RepID=UPI00197FF79A|nr:DUF368 domain-containing protein [Longirhabdus pacifica]
MAVADSVPGVSGGTIAFILGFYDKFIQSLHGVIAGPKEKRVASLHFLLKLGIGWILGLMLSIVFITSLLESNIYEVSSLFLGFIIVAIYYVFKEEKHEFVGKYNNVIFLILGVTIVFAITFFNPVSSEGTSMSLDQLHVGLALYVFIAAMIAISAMVLPGISGSTLLLIFGLYAPILAAIKEVMTFNFDYFFVVLLFGLGILTGIFATIRWVKYALDHYRSQTMYCIMGLMIGSLYAVVMGPTTLEVPQDQMSWGTFHPLFFFIGGGLILLLEKLNPNK